MTSIKTKISVYLFLLVLGISSAYVFYEYQETKHELYSKLKFSAERKISRLAENLIIPLWEVDDRWVKDIITTETMDNNLQAIVVTGADNLLVVQKRDEDWKVSSENAPLSGEVIFKQRQVMQGTEPIGQVEIYLTTRFIENDLKAKLIKTIITVAILSFAIFIFLELMLGKIVVNPLNKLVLATKQIAKGQYDIPLENKKRDEISRLANDFNTMREQIELRENERNSALANVETAKDKLHQLNENLESKVTERTQALEESNQHLQRLSAEFESAKDDAELANRAKSVFLASMSHELRTPMNAVLGFSRLMREEAGLSTSQKESLDIINRSGHHLLNLINDVLDMAKIESGQIELVNAPFDLGLLVRDIMDLMQERAEKKALHLTFDQSSSFPRFIISDATKIRQILVNLLSNAIKHTNSGSVTLLLNILEQQNTDDIYLHFEVQDTGVGISDDDLASIFSAFIQVGEQSTQEGTGLGLAITQQYIELMNGSINVSSELGAGSVFQVEIPVQAVNAEQLATIQPSSNRKVIRLADKQPDYRVLIVEDQLENRLLLKRLLESVGFKVQEAINGQQGVEQFKQWKPHFIWMDRRMPIMGGVEAIRKIRALPRGDLVQIVAVTASVFEQEREILIQAGASEIVNKPYKDEEIFSCMAKYLNVEYIYKDNKEDEPILDEESFTIFEKKIESLPEELLNKLNNAATSLDVEQSLQVIKQIKLTDAALAEKLQRLVEAFDFETLLEKIKTVA